MTFIFVAENVYSFDDQGQGTVVDQSPKIINMEDVRKVERARWLPFNAGNILDRFSGDFTQITYKSGDSDILALSFDQFIKESKVIMFEYDFSDANFKFPKRTPKEQGIRDDPGSPFCRGDYDGPEVETSASV